jgi:predicted DNA-binding antitoxin AbrB/MazE fold protein
MTMTIQAVFAGGVLRPVEPLTLAEGQTVELTIEAGPHQPLSEEEVIRRIQACQNYQEWLAVTKTLPTDDGGYDIVKALDENRSWSGDRPLFPVEGGTQ